MGLIGSRVASSSALGRGSVVASTGVLASMAVDSGAVLIITGTTSTDRGAANFTAVSVAAKTSTAAVAGTSTAAGASAAVTQSVVETQSAVVAAFTAEEVSTVVDTVAAATADAGKFLRSSTPQTAGSTLCRPFPFWVRIRYENEAMLLPSAKNPTTRNALVVATMLGVVECG
jgi:hypothetical protein